MAAFYHLFMNFMERVFQNVERVKKFSGGHPVLQLDGVSTYLKLDGRTTNRIAILNSFLGHVIWCSWASTALQLFVV